MVIEWRRWFHHDLSGVQAERLLLEKGVPGSFLVRHSRNNPGNFTLSVRLEDSVAHIRIQNTGDFLDLYGGEKFATLSELVDHYREKKGEIKEKNGPVIELKYPLFCQDLIAERWFHGRITRLEAQNLLSEKGKYGSFLVREAIKQPGSYVLSVVTGEPVSHILINRKPDNKFDVGCGNRFSNLKELIDFYSNTPMVDKNGGLVFLKQPFNATRFNVSNIHERIRQLGRENYTGSSLAGFLEEFEVLHHDFQDTKLKSRSEGAKPYNLNKNRYKNILPFDHTNVRLHDGDPNIPGSDYINANYVSWPHSLTESLMGGSTTVDPVPPTSSAKAPDHSQSSSPPLSSSSSSTATHRRRYIATQGTLRNTVDDFWRMIWQERSTIIVMITKEVERTRSKCWKYWPPQLQGTLELPTYGGTLRVRNLSERHLETYTLRELHLSRDPQASETATINAKDTSGGSAGFVVYHYQFHAWPDHGTPSDPSCVVNFIFDISKRLETLSDCGPMVVHCSAGIGRSGTYIVIDMLINYIKQCGLQCEIDISRTIQAVREQRSGMVQTETQYRFIYHAIHHFVSTLSQRQQLNNGLQPRDADYANINQASAEVRQIYRADFAVPLKTKDDSLTSPYIRDNTNISPEHDNQFPLPYANSNKPNTIPSPVSSLNK